MQNLNFREFVDLDLTVSSLYQNGMKIRDIAERTKISIPQIYRSLERMGGCPNRINNRHHEVKEFAKYGLKNQHIADLTGYNIRNVSYILKKGK